MDIKIEVVRENEDGSADALVNFDKEGLGFLIQEGMTSILMQYIKQCKKESKRKKKDAKKNAGS